MCQRPAGRDKPRTTRYGAAAPIVCEKFHEEAPALKIWNVAGKTIGFIIASIVAVITLISSLILAFPAARAGRAFEAQIRAERANRTKGR